MFYEKWNDPDERKGLHGEFEYIEFDVNEGYREAFYILTGQECNLARL